MLTKYVAKIIVVPYLWFGGYQMDDESVLECYDSIEIQCNQEEVSGSNKEELIWMLSSFFNYS